MKVGHEQSPMTRVIVPLCPLSSQLGFSRCPDMLGVTSVFGARREFSLHEFLSLGDLPTCFEQATNKMRWRGGCCSWWAVFEKPTCVIQGCFMRNWCKNRNVAQSSK